MTLLLVGYVVRAHGIAGEIKVSPYTDTPEDFCKIPNFVINGIKYNNKTSRIMQDNVLLKLDGVTNRNMAEEIRGEIYAERQSLPALKGRYYITDIIGFDIFCETKRMGVLSEVLKISSVDTYVVSCDKNSFSFPALMSVIEKIDIDSRRIYVNELELNKVIVYEV